jgi:hypothetical protein
MQRVLIVSRCLNYDSSWGQFHFKGFYKGLKINEIKVRMLYDINLREGDDYMIYLELEHIQDSTIWGRALKWKNLTSQH